MATFAVLCLQRGNFLSYHYLRCKRFEYLFFDPRQTSSKMLVARLGSGIEQVCGYCNTFSTRDLGYLHMQIPKIVFIDGRQRVVSPSSNLLVDMYRKRIYEFIGSTIARGVTDDPFFQKPFVSGLVPERDHRSEHCFFILIIYSQNDRFFFFSL